MPARHGITFPGFLLAGGAGLYLGTAAVGYIALAILAVTTPAALIAPLAGSVLLGPVAGVVVAYGTRRAIRPRMPHRYGRSAIAGLASMPGFLSFSRLPGIQETQSAVAEWTVGAILCCGAAGMVMYYQWRKRLARQRLARQRLARQRPLRTA